MREQPQENGGTEALSVLRRSPLFATVRDEILLQLLEGAQRLAYGRGDSLLQPGDTEDGIFLIANGSVRLYRVTRDGREVTLADFGVGDLYGLSFVGSRASPHGILAATTDNVLVYRFSRVQFRALTAQHPEVALRAIDQLEG